MIRNNSIHMITCSSTSQLYVSIEFILSDCWPEIIHTYEPIRDSLQVCTCFRSGEFSISKPKQLKLISVQMILLIPLSSQQYSQEVYSLTLFGRVLFARTYILTGYKKTFPRDFLKRTLQNYQKIVNKSFLGTDNVQ